MTKIIYAMMKEESPLNERVPLAVINKGESIKLTTITDPRLWSSNSKVCEKDMLIQLKILFCLCHIEDTEGFTYKWDEFELMLKTHPHGFEIKQYQLEKENGKKKTT